MENQIKINPSKIGKVLFITALVLCVLSMGLWYFPRKFLFSSYNLDELFSVDNENNIPTYFSSLLFLIASLVTFAIAKLKRGQANSYHIHWMILATGFLYMSIDESAILHEKLITLTNRLFSIRSDFLEYSWVIPGILIVLLLAIYYFPFIRHLPRRTMWLMVMSGFIFVIGAIGFEMLGSYAYNHFTLNSREYTVIVTIEEFFEMTGLILFIYTALDYLSKNHSPVSLRFHVGKILD